MDWAAIGPLLAGLGALIVAAAGWLTRRDNRKLAQVSVDQARLDTAWTIQEAMFQEQRDRIIMLTEINKDLMTRQTESDKTINTLRAENTKLARRVEVLERKLQNDVTKRPSNGH